MSGGSALAYQHSGSMEYALYPREVSVSPSPSLERHPTSRWVPIGSPGYPNHTRGVSEQSSCTEGVRAGGGSSIRSLQVQLEPDIPVAIW